MGRIRRHEDGDLLRAGENCVEQLDRLSCHVTVEISHARNVSGWMGKALDEAGTNRVG